MGPIIKIILYTILIVGIGSFIPGIEIESIWPTAIIAGLGFAVLNTIIRAMLPDNIIFGIVAVILNGVGFWYIGNFLPGFEVSTYLAALIGSVVASAGVWIINEIF